MASPYDLIVRGGTVVSHDGLGGADIAIREGRIAGIGDFARTDAAQAIDAGGLHVLPGVIDTQVHFREPGNEHKEDLESGTRAAVLGGVTAVFEMPNTAPPTTGAEALADKFDRAAGRAWCDHAFYVGADGKNTAELCALERLPGVCGVKLFMGSSTGTLLVAEDAEIARVLQSGVRRVAVHAEDEARLVARRGIAIDAGDVRAHPVWRDERTALGAVQRLMALARAAGRRVHVLHVTTAAEITFLARFKEFATVEVTPQRLTLAAPDCYERLGTRAQMNPPIRDNAHREGLWRGVREGIVDIVGSDHAPHTLEEKAAPYPDSPSGMPGVQTLVPVMLDHVNAGRLSLLTSDRPGVRGPGARLRHRRQGTDRHRLRWRPHDRRSQGAARDHRFLDRLALRLDPLRRRHRHRLADRHRDPRPGGDARGRGPGTPGRRAAWVRRRNRELHDLDP